MSQASSTTTIWAPAARAGDGLADRFGGQAAIITATPVGANARGPAWARFAERVSAFTMR
jgi:hypothetical protein